MLDWIGFTLLALAALILLGLFVVFNVAAWQADDPIAVPLALLVDAGVLGGAGWLVLDR